LEDIYIVGGVRTAIGDFGGSLKAFMPSDLGAMVVTEALRRANVASDDVEHVIMGQVMATGPKDQFLARVVGLKANIPVTTPALTLNRLCGSGVPSRQAHLVLIRFSVPWPALPMQTGQWKLRLVSKMLSERQDSDSSLFASNDCNVVVSC
jgi:hypothetical protein